EARVEEPLDQRDLQLGRDELLLGLKAVAGTDLDERDALGKNHRHAGKDLISRSPRLTPRQGSRTLTGVVKSPGKAAPSVLVVVTSVGTEEQALVIAQRLVESQLAAYVNIVPGVRSVFRWKGKVQHEGEFLLVAKTLKKN